MKTEELHKKALVIMSKHKIDEVFATKDGNVFLPKNRTAADFHGKNTQQKVYHLKKDDLVIEDKAKTSQEPAKDNKNDKEKTDKKTK